MSWDKNTINSSHIDAVVDTLKRADIPYEVKVLGQVRGMGLNDGFDYVNFHEVRRLQYRNTVILEQMRRSSDCDMDDYLESFTFDLDKEPKEWPLEYITDEY